MSIISDAFTRKTTWATAAARIGLYITQAFPSVASSEPVAAGVAQLTADLKQSASDALSLADTALGPILGAAAVAVETAADKALLAAIGPLATLVTPAVDAVIIQTENALIAAVRSRTLAMRAALAPSAPAPSVPTS